MQTNPCHISPMSSPSLQADTWPYHLRVYSCAGINTLTRLQDQGLDQLTPVPPGLSLVWPNLDVVWPIWYVYWSDHIGLTKKHLVQPRLHLVWPDLYLVWPSCSWSDQFCSISIWSDLFCSISTGLTFYAIETGLTFSILSKLVWPYNLNK